MTAALFDRRRSPGTLVAALGGLVTLGCVLALLLSVRSRRSIVSLIATLGLGGGFSAWLLLSPAQGLAGSDSQLLGASGLMILAFCVYFDGVTREEREHYGEQVAVGLVALWLVTMWAASFHRLGWPHELTPPGVVECSAAAQAICRTAVALFAAGASVFAVAVGPENKRRALLPLPAFFATQSCVEVVSLVGAKGLCAGAAVNLESLAHAADVLEALGGAAVAVLWLRSLSVRPNRLVPLLLLSTSPYFGSLHDPYPHVQPPEDVRATLHQSRSLVVIASGEAYAYRLLRPTRRTHRRQQRDALIILVDDRTTFGDLRRATRTLREGEALAVVRSARASPASGQRWPFVERGSHTLRARKILLGTCRNCERAYRPITAGDDVRVANWIRRSAYRVPVHGERMRPPLLRGSWVLGASVGLVLFLMFGVSWICRELRRARTLRRHAEARPGPKAHLPTVPAWVSRHEGVRMCVSEGSPYRGNARFVVVARRSVAHRALRWWLGDLVVVVLRTLLSAAFAIIASGILGHVLSIWW
ncbi:MAG: hypothetical protein AAGE52_21930 [Myxococcota bacterium]